MLVSASGNDAATETIDSANDAGWDIHWSYRCAKGFGVFALDVFNSDHTPDFRHPGIDEQGGGQDSGDYHVPGKGRFYLEVTTTCAWTLKVVQSA